jgi:hypothetical protein
VGAKNDLNSLIGIGFVFFEINAVTEKGELNPPAGLVGTVTLIGTRYAAKTG